MIVTRTLEKTDKSVEKRTPSTMTVYDFSETDTTQKNHMALDNKMVDADADSAWPTKTHTWQPIYIWYLVTIFNDIEQFPSLSRDRTHLQQL